jgi:hypothetical protein
LLRGEAMLSGSDTLSAVMAPPARLQDRQSQECGRCRSSGVAQVADHIRPTAGCYVVTQRILSSAQQRGQEQCVGRSQAYTGSSCAYNCWGPSAATHSRLAQQLELDPPAAAGPAPQAPT